MLGRTTRRWWLLVGSSRSERKGKERKRVAEVKCRSRGYIGLRTELTSKVVDLTSLIQN